MTRSELLARMGDERKTLEELYEKFDVSDLEKPMLDDGWSIKDVMAHIAAWERRLTNAITAVRRGERPAWPEEGYSLSDADVDALNARDRDASAARSLAAVRVDAETAYREALAAITPFSDAQLADSMNPERPPWEAVIRANTDQHYREHIDQIESWLAGQGA